MSEEYGSDIITITDDEGNTYSLEHLDTMELDGVYYLAFTPADMDPEDEEYGMVLLKEETEGDESFLVQLDEDELDRVYDKFMERLYPEEEEEQ